MKKNRECSSTRLDLDIGEKAAGPRKCGVALRYLVLECLRKSHTTRFLSTPIFSISNSMGLPERGF